MDFSFDSLIAAKQRSDQANREPPSPLKEQPEPKRPDLRSNSAAKHAFTDTEIDSSVKPLDLQPLKEFDKNRFPTALEILCRILFEQKLSENRKINCIAKQIYNELFSIIAGALAIPKPTIKMDKCVKKIE